MSFLGISKKHPGKPIPEKKPQVNFGDISLSGAIYASEDLTQGNADVTATANTGASTDENWIKVTNPSNVARFIQANRSKLLVDLETAAPAHIVSGTLAFVIANADQSRTRLVNRIDLNVFDTIANQRSQLFQKNFPFDIALAPQYILFLKVNSASTLSTSNSTLTISGIRKASNVTIDAFLKDYPEWALV